MALEQTINLDSKTKGGIVGISKQQGPSASECHSCSEKNVWSNVNPHTAAAPSRMKRDEEGVQKLLSTISSGLTNPFSLDIEDGDDDVYPLLILLQVL